jgi:TrkA domain protein
MGHITETRLPGVGVRFDFTSSSGQRIGVIAHASGRRELIVCGSDDPDSCRDVVRLDEDDARTLAEVLGQSQVTEQVDAMRLQLYGLTVDWLPVSEKSACAHCTIHEIEHIEESSAAVVAVVREGELIATPPSTFALQPGDTAVAIGTVEGVDRLFKLLQG